MSNHQGYAYPPAVGYGAYMVIRGLVKLFQTPAETSKPTYTQAAAPIITPPPRPAPPPGPPVVQWAERRELIAFRAWRLLTVMFQRGEDTSGLRLISLSAPCIWNGPVARVAAPLADVTPPSGIYALKPDIAERSQWPFLQECWLTGIIALSGRVIEHADGYRAERAVVRSIRLAVGAHLVLRALKELQFVIESLETRYQVAVDVGQAEREAADRMCMTGMKPTIQRPNWTAFQDPWRLI